MYVYVVHFAAVEKCRPQLNNSGDDIEDSDYINAVFVPVSSLFTK